MIEFTVNSQPVALDVDPECPCCGHCGRTWP